MSAQTGFIVAILARLEDKTRLQYEFIGPGVVIAVVNKGCCRMKELPFFLFFSL